MVDGWDLFGTVFFYPWLNFYRWFSTAVVMLVFGHRLYMLVNPKYSCGDGSLGASVVVIAMMLIRCYNL